MQDEESSVATRLMSNQPKEWRSNTREIRQVSFRGVSTTREDPLHDCNGSSMVERHHGMHGVQDRGIGVGRVGELLYAATHSSVWKLPSGSVTHPLSSARCTCPKARRVSARIQATVKPPPPPPPPPLQFNGVFQPLRNEVF